MTTLTAATAAKLEALSGLIPHDEGLALADLAAAVPATEAIVELGSFKGKSTAYLAAGAKRGGGAARFCRRQALGGRAADRVIGPLLA